MELGALSISPSMLKPMPVSPCLIYRYAALDRPSSKHAELYIRASQNPPRSFHSAHGRSSTFALSSKSYWAQLYKRKNLETSGGAICPQGNAEQKVEGKRESSIIRSVKSCQLRWDSQETKMVPLLVFSPISGAPKNFSKRNHSSSQRPTNSVGTDMRKSGRPGSRCNYQTTSFAFTELRDQIGARATSLDSKTQMPSPAERCRLYQTGAYSSLSNLGWLDFTSFKGRRIDKDGALTLEAAVETSASSSPSSGAAQSDSGGNSREKPSKRAGSGASSVSSGVRLEHISKTFKGATLLTDVNWEVKKGEKVGLVGVNGAGKTTQLKIIVGEEEPDTGNVIKAKENMKIAFLTQEFEVIPSQTVREEFMSAFAEQMNISDRIEKVQKALESATDDLILMGNLLDELDGLQRQAEAVDLYDVDVKINKMMPELGFNQEDGDRLVASFSGGWQMRMSLGKILLEDPDLLLLDEPTNHLDLDTIEWLENYLKKQDVPMVIVSHDRAFLDQLCTKIVETDMGVSHTFEGNYSDYVLAKAAWVETQRLAWEKQQKEISRTKDIIMRLSGGANSGRATTAEKQLEKIQEDQLVEKPFEHKQIKFRFPELDRSGRTVVVVKNMGLQYEGKVLFQNANLVVERGEKLAVIGPNGCGKSTLLRMIMGFEEPTSGEVHLGEHGVLPNYFEQNQAEALDLKKTVLQTVEEAAEDWNMNDIRGLLGRCNFKGDMVHRKVAFLSGGEKARLALCNFMVTPSTLLVLDEPTNHLDIPSKEMLEEAIREYRGTVIAVSHDRYFLRQIVNRVVEVKNHALQNYGGDYNYYLEQNLEARRRELEREAELEAKAPTVKAKSKMSKAEKELQKKQKALAFQQGKAKSKVTKNAKRWN